MIQQSYMTTNTTLYPICPESKTATAVSPQSSARPADVPLLIPSVLQNAALPHLQPDNLRPKPHGLHDPNLREGQTDHTPPPEILAGFWLQLLALVEHAPDAQINASHLAAELRRATPDLTRFLPRSRMKPAAFSAISSQRWSVPPSTPSPSPSEQWLLLQRMSIELYAMSRKVSALEGRLVSLTQPGNQLASGLDPVDPPSYLAATQIRLSPPPSEAAAGPKDQTRQSLPLPTW